MNTALGVRHTGTSELTKEAGAGVESWWTFFLVVSRDDPSTHLFPAFGLSAEPLARPSQPRRADSVDKPGFRPQFRKRSIMINLRQQLFHVGGDLVLACAEAAPFA